ncbi:MAG TPA: dimethylsulfonioproprionate lyase family protein [Longimicrobiaceae bacterium]|jgi:quercetin dioxygenase-like cupin family protein|nr:dimethylsulfonioproprionate lyase family protein [Longimicrobiaceae bacterium]
MLQESMAVAGPAILHAGEGHVVGAYGSQILFKITGEDSAGQLTVGLAMVPPGVGPPPHREAADELFIIVEGRYEVMTEGRWTEVGPGAVVYHPRGCVHAFRNAGDSIARHWVLNLAGDFARFFEESAEVFAAPGAPDRARLAEIARAYGSEIV